MGFLTDEELHRLSPAESSLFRSPIPVQSVSSDEFAPAPQSAKQREFESRVKALGADLAKRQNMSRRRFFKKHLGERPLARSDGIAIEQRHRAEDFRSPEVKANRRPVLDRLLHVRQAMQPDRQNP